MENPDMNMDGHLGCVAAVGMFDGVHEGHRSLLSDLLQIGRRRNMPVAVITFRGHPLSLIAPGRAPRLLSAPEEKERLLRAIGVDRVIFEDFTPEFRAMTGVEFLKMLREKYGVKALVAGFNNHFGSDRMDAATATAHSVETGVEIISSHELHHESGTAVSSSAIRAFLAAGDVCSAAALLGSPYILYGKVVTGKGLGRTIGFPTANVAPWSPSALVPAPGVYAVDVRIEGFEEKFRGMMNIGFRPTVDNAECADISQEVNIFDFSADIYGRTVGVEFLKRLRDEVAFPDIDALKERLVQDMEEARQL